MMTPQQGETWIREEMTSTIVAGTKVVRVKRTTTSQILMMTTLWLRRIGGVTRDDEPPRQVSLHHLRQVQQEGGGGKSGVTEAERRKIHLLQRMILTPLQSTGLELGGGQDLPR